MARTRATRQVYADLLARYGQQVADAFYEALDTIRSGVEVQRITAALAIIIRAAMTTAARIQTETSKAPLRPCTSTRRPSTASRTS